MRLLKINDIIVDIDEKTTIGVNYQSYDIKSVGDTFVTTSNTFTIPKTSNNSAIFGNADNVQSLSTTVYEEITCNYWVDNDKLINNARCRVEEIQERISVFIFQKDDIWDTLKKVNWVEFEIDFIEWLQINKGLPSLSSPFVGTSLTFLSTYAAATEGVLLPMYFGNLYKYDPEDDGTFLEDSSTIYLEYTAGPILPIKARGGHFSVYVKTIFEYIEDTYDVNFLTSGGVLPGNIWDDSIASSIYVPLRDLEIVYSGTPAASTIYFQIIPFNLFNWFAPFPDLQDKEAKSLYDLVNSFMQHFNVLKDDAEVNGEPVIRLARFDDLELTAEVVDWSGGLEGIKTYKPKIEGYAQDNRIKFKSIYPEGDALLNSKTLESSNLNLDATIDLFEIDAYVNATISIGLEVVPDLSVKESFKTFSFLINDGLTANNINVKIYDEAIDPVNPIELGALNLPVASLYSLASEYNFLDDIITYPKYYEVKKWLTQSALKNFEFFKQYFIRELNGSFFINKISGFNPDKANEATTLELIRLGNRTPITPPDLDYWTDGVADGFTDGINDLFF